jgi:uncharacterized protein with beta-barrel porin domain
MKTSRPSYALTLGVALLLPLLAPAAWAEYYNDGYGDDDDDPRFEFIGQDPDEIDSDEVEDGVGSAVVAPDALRVPTLRGAAAQRVQKVLQAGGGAGFGQRGHQASGLAAGDAPSLAGFSIWTGYGRSNFRGDAARAHYEGDNSTWTVGADRIVAERWLVGLSLSYEDTDTRTFYNGGGQQIDGFGFAPYVGVSINEFLSLDAAGGMTFTETDQGRVGLTPLGAIEEIRSRFDAERWFGTVNLNAHHDVGTLALNGRIGYLYVEETQDAYRETGTGGALQALRPRTVGEREVSLGQVYAGGEIAGRFERAMPYLGALYRNDVSREDGAAAGGLPAAIGRTLTPDRDEVELTAGLRWFGENVFGSVEYLKTIGRERFQNDTFQALLRIAL